MFSQISIRSALISALIWSGRISIAAHSRSKSHVSTGSAKQNNTLSSMLKCAKEWSSYDSLVSANVFMGPEVTTYPVVRRMILTYGTGKVYTSTAGIPVARGTFTSTSAVVTIFTRTETDTNYYVRRTTGVARTQTTPACSSLHWQDCSRLYTSYIHSLGLPQNATVPSVYPPPPNSPACPVYNYLSWTTCHETGSIVPGWPGCSVTADNVQLFYFEPTTSKAHASITDIVVHTFAPGTTLTSPSIYLLFDNLTAAAEYYGPADLCTTCASGNCVTIGYAGGIEVETIGSRVDNTMLSFAPDQVSTVFASFGPQASQYSAVSAIARNGTGYLADVAVIPYSFWYDPWLPLTTQQIHLGDIRHPPPTAYYLNPMGAPGCGGFYPAPACSTIFEGMYRPMLALPTQVIGLKDFWKGCHPYAGVSDPPKVVKPTTLKKPKMHPGNRIRQLDDDVNGHNMAFKTTETATNSPSYVGQILPSPSPIIALETSIAASQWLL